MEYIPSPMYAIIADIVHNNKNLTPELQNAIALFIKYESEPRMKIATKFEQFPGKVT